MQTSSEKTEQLKILVTQVTDIIKDSQNLITIEIVKDMLVKPVGTIQITTLLTSIIIKQRGTIMKLLVTQVTELIKDSQNMITIPLTTISHLTFFVRIPGGMGIIHLNVINLIPTRWLVSQ